MVTRLRGCGIGFVADAGRQASEANVDACRKSERVLVRQDAFFNDQVASVKQLLVQIRGGFANWVVVRRIRQPCGQTGGLGAEVVELRDSIRKAAELVANLDAKIELLLQIFGADFHAGIDAEFEGRGLGFAVDGEADLVLAG